MTNVSEGLRLPLLVKITRLSLQRSIQNRKRRIHKYTHTLLLILFQV